MPYDTKKFSSSLGSYWFDEENLLHFRANDTPRTTNNILENFKIVRDIIGDARPCLLADLGDMAPLSKEARELIISEIQNTYRAVALIPSSPLGKVIATTFIVMKKKYYPAKMFENETGAKLWLKQYRS